MKFKLKLSLSLALTFFILIIFGRINVLANVLSHSTEIKAEVDTIENFEQVQFEDQTLSVDDLMQPQALESSPDLLFSDAELLMAMDPGLDGSNADGWAESVQMEEMSPGEAQPGGWDTPAETGGDMDLAASALDLAPDTSGVVTMTESPNTESLAGLQDSGSF